MKGFGAAVPRVLCALSLAVATLAVDRAHAAQSTWATLAADDWARGDGTGATIWGLSRTELRTSSVRTARDEILGYQPLWQTFRFLVRDDNPTRRFSFETSLRGGGDLRRGGFSGEVQVAAIELAPAPRFGFLRLGRQFVVAGNESGLLRIDGARGQLTLGRLGLEGWGGVALRTDRVFAPEAPVTGWGHDWAWGAAAFLANHAATQARLSWTERFRQGVMVRRALGFDLHQGVRGRFHVRANLVVDVMGRSLSELRAGIDALPLPWLTLTAQLESFRPTFDADEVWSVFRTDPYVSITGSATARIGAVATLWAGGGAQLVEEAKSKDETAFPELGRATGQQHAGVRLSPTPWLNIEVGERLVDGVGGMKVGVDAQVRVRPWKGRLDAGVRGTWQRYAFDLQPNLAGHYGSIGADVAAEPTSFLRARLGATVIFSPFLRNDVQIFAIVDVILGAQPRGKKGSAVASWEPALRAAAGTDAVLRPERRAAGLGGGIGLGGEGR